jgi:hypothetical protein
MSEFITAEKADKFVIRQDEDGYFVRELLISLDTPRYLNEEKPIYTDILLSITDEEYEDIEIRLTPDFARQFAETLKSKADEAEALNKELVAKFPQKE